MDDFWRDKHVVVTGSHGLVGGFLIEHLVSAGAVVTAIDDLSRGRPDRLRHIRGIVMTARGDAAAQQALPLYRGADVVFNLAAKVTGMHYNREHHCEMFCENMRLQMLPLLHALRAGVKRFCQVSTVCVYPHDMPYPVPEDWGHRGEPEPTNAGYGWAKRMGERLAQWAAHEYGLEVAIVRPSNMYGPWDYFDEATSHVIPALIRRAVESREDHLLVYGSGQQIREFLYADDGAVGMMKVTERYAAADPVNIGTGMETAISIADLAMLIQEVCAEMGAIRAPRALRFDTSLPDGYPRRGTDISKLIRVTGWQPAMPLRDGLRHTIAWWLNRERGQ